MIEVIMKFGPDIILIRIAGHDVKFSNLQFGAVMASIDGLKLSRPGVIKEFPDLKDNPNWNMEAIARFKDKIRDLDQEELIEKYLIEDLSKFGYVPMYRQKAGWRREQIKPVKIEVPNAN